MLTSLVLGTTSYSSSGVAYSGYSGPTPVGWGPARISGLRVSLDDESNWSAEFTAMGCGPAIPFVPGIPVKLYTSNDDGSSPVLRFAGDLQRPEVRESSHGPAWGYCCTDLKRRSDAVTLLASDGSATASYNLTPGDPLYLFNLAGQTVGQIVTDVLQATPNAASLVGLGVGNYSGSGPYFLPSATVSDLAALSIVPPTPVQLQGEGILNRLQAFIRQWHSQYTLYVEPTGTIRVVPIFGRTAYTFTRPSALVAGDPVDFPPYCIDVADCYAAVQVTGLDITAAVLSTKLGTLTPAWTGPQQAAWTLASFTSPSNSDSKNNASDSGTIVSMTSNTAVVKSDFAPVHWDLNFWNSNGGVITIISVLDDGGPTGSTIETTFTVKVTACTAMSAGGTATITWDASEATSGTGFTKYKLFATNTAESLVSRAYWVTNPSNGHTGLNTVIGSHLFPYFPFGYAWANNVGGASSAQVINYPEALILWSPDGNYPYYSAGIPLDLDPARGLIILSKPAVVVAAGFAGQVPGLNGGYPATYYQGKPVDVQVAVPYNRGAISTRYPSSGYNGTAHSKYGVTRVKTIALNSFNWKGNTAAINALAQQILLTIQDAVIEGSVNLHYDAWTPTFDVFAFPYALNIANPGGLGEIEGEALPVRSMTMEWPEDGADIHRVSFRFSNRHRSFEGDALYTHPAFAPTGWGSQGGDVFMAGGFEGIAVGLDTPGFGSHDVGNVSNAEIAAMSGNAITPEVAAMTGDLISPEVAANSGGPPNAGGGQAAARSDRPATPQDIANAGPKAAQDRRIAERKKEQEQGKIRAENRKTVANSDRVPLSGKGDPPREGAERFERQDVKNGDFGGDVGDPGTMEGGG